MFSPLTRIESTHGRKVFIERTPTGWYYGSSGGMTAQVRGYRDGLACRVAPGDDREVVQLGIGPTASLLCNAIYSPSRDEALLFSAEKLVLSTEVKGSRLACFTVACEGPLTLTVVRDYLRVHRDLPWFTPLNRARFRRAPAGWCSWYYYYLNINEAEIVKNTDWLAEHLKPFGCEWVQVDDGWQGRGTGFGSNRDWFEVSERDFPQGMQWIAQYIRTRGLRPGIWCIPFTQSDPEYYTDNPHLFLRTADGTSPGERQEPLPHEWMPDEERFFEWEGRYFIDPTGDEGEAYLKGLATLLCKDWGFDYVKIDGQSGMLNAYRTYRAQLADPALDGDRAYRNGVQRLKAVLGPNRFLLNCGQGWPALGLCEGVRTGGDVTLSWAGIQSAVEATARWLFLNTLACYTDPDVVCVRDPLPLAQAELWTVLLGITGQILMTSDKMYALSDERVQLLTRIFPVADIHPMELYPLDTAAPPGIFDLKVQHPTAGTWDVVALFNWHEQQPRQVTLTPDRLGLPAGAWVCLDGLTGALLHDGEGVLTVPVPPAACRVVTYWPAADRPQFVGSSRHLTQGADDVGSIRWDENRHTLSGVAHVVANERYTLRIFVPEGYRVTSRTALQEGRLATLTLLKAKKGKVKWTVEFALE